ncbi:MAG: hypothetical protein ACJ77K_19750 [Bacteroidia bacterium]
MGAVFYYALENTNSISIGAGLSRIDYRKEWQGVFPSNNQFGVATLDGRLEYWSFPLTYSISSRSSRWRYTCYRISRWSFGFDLTYTPSFISKASSSLNTSNGLSSDPSLEDFKSNEQSFQHSLAIGLPYRINFADKLLRLDVEPYAGICSGYFRETGSRVDNLVYGVRLRFCIRAKLPQITIDHEVNTGNSEQKKQDLLKKQQEIRDQLNKQPK